MKTTVEISIKTLFQATISKSYSQRTNDDYLGDALKNLPSPEN